MSDAVDRRIIAELEGYDNQRREVRYGKNSRIDLLLESAARPPCYVEVKNVHLMRQDGLAEFPDSVTARGAKHLSELSAMVTDGARAVMVYLIQRGKMWKRFNWHATSILPMARPLMPPRPPVSRPCATAAKLHPLGSTSGAQFHLHFAKMIEGFDFSSLG